MLKIENPIKITEAVALDPNLATRFDEHDLDSIGNEVWRGYDVDEQSRAPWLRRSRAAMQLALQIKPGKSWPWPKASNVAFPLLTIAALQFHSRAYPTLFAGSELVKYRVPGVDQTGELAQRARIVSKFMSYQVTDLDEAFEEQHDRLLINVPIVGCGFIKSRYVAHLGTNVSEFVSAQDLVIDYFAKSVDSALRKTQLIPLYRNEVHERCVGGTFLDILDEPWYQAASTPVQRAADAERDRVAGRTPPPPGDDSALLFLEQHTWLDLDDDGYAEPYIVTIHEASKKVVRIVARWDSAMDVERIGSRIIRITPSEHFTKYGLVPSPDGGIYDIGFGNLIGPLGESVDTIVNQLIDAGTLATTAGGFLARGVKIRGGAMTIDPFGWKTVETSGDDLRKGVFPLPVREPSAVLFNLLSLLINYTQRIGGATDVMVGENPGQNTPATNMKIMLEQGTKIYSAIFKRLWRSMRAEFRKLYLLNGRHLDESVRFGTETVYRKDFLGDPANLVPVADPTMASEAARLQLAITMKEAAATTPGYNKDAVERNFLKALGVDNTDEFFPGTEGQEPPEDPKLTMKKLDIEQKQAALAAAQEQFIAELEETMRLNDAQIALLEAQAHKTHEEAEDVSETAQREAGNTAIAAMRVRNEALAKQRDAAIKEKQGAKRESRE